MILGNWMILVVYLRTEFGVILDFLYWETAGLSDIHGLSIASNPESPIVFLILEKSTGSMKNDLQLLEDIADWVSIVLWRHTRIFICYLFSQYLCWFGFLLLLHLQALKEDGVFVVTSKRSMLDKCRLPVGIRLFVSAAHSEADLVKACESLKRISAVVLRDRNWVIHTASHTAPVHCIGYVSELAFICQTILLFRYAPKGLQLLIIVCHSLYSFLIVFFFVLLPGMEHVQLSSMLFRTTEFADFC